MSNKVQVDFSLVAGDAIERLRVSLEELTRRIASLEAAAVLNARTTVNRVAITYTDAAGDVVTTGVPFGTLSPPSELADRESAAWKRLTEKRRAKGRR